MCVLHVAVCSAWCMCVCVCCRVRQIQVGSVLAVLARAGGRHVEAIPVALYHRLAALSRGWGFIVFNYMSRYVRVYVCQYVYLHIRYTHIFTRRDVFHDGIDSARVSQH